ncbi:ArsR/SmtB family transcription factor [Halanaerobacter jeridensis]|uniref:DNA-binding transcriptional ArsR family regulator n=1 Tax=Halanaerobacter jeridensis TaxID=706427 RepID=A0A938XQJ2_9FIRM|nr:metalloregulator ArsR/SmtB family transcription factor [Halanaerobacter jeridensis]MBM7555764.1 DNA-binding transcriptional ArsR family regulator [Halanaerobacter jeridensis]
MKTDKNKDNDRKKLAQLSKALSHPYRVQIIEILSNLPSDKQCMVSSLVDQLPIAQSTVSQHLKILKEAGWIKGRIEGPKVCYCLEKNIFEDYQQLIDNIQNN